MKKNQKNIFEKQYGTHQKIKYRDMPILYSLLSPLSKHRNVKVGELINGNNLKVLEIGCGDGSFLYQYRNKWQDIVGIDIVKQRINEAKKRNYYVPTKFITMNIDNATIPYPSDHFDVVICISTLQYIKDLELLFAEIKRILTSHGQCIIEVPNSAAYWRRIQFLFGIFPKTSQFDSGWDAGVIHYFTSGNLTSFITSLGFRIQRISCSGILDNIREYWASLFGGDLIFVLEK